MGTMIQIRILMKLEKTKKEPRITTMIRPAQLMINVLSKDKSSMEDIFFTGFFGIKRRHTER